MKFSQSPFSSIRRRCSGTRHVQVSNACRAIHPFANNVPHRSFHLTTGNDQVLRYPFAILHHLQSRLQVADQFFQGLPSSLGSRACTGTCFSNVCNRFTSVAARPW